jgi:glycosyltransferase involved in cell wall biosynthesis
MSYRSKPHCGGQGVYVRHLSRELVALGHSVEVLSGQPYPELDGAVGRGPTLREVPSLDLYREPDPFRLPHMDELRDAVDVVELASMWTGAFPEPLTFSVRAARLLAGRRREFDVVHDNQSLGYGLLALSRVGLPLVATVHHPITVDRRIELGAERSPARRLMLRRWYGFHRMQRRVARRIGCIITVSRASADDIVRDFGVRRGALRVVPIGVDARVFRAADAPRVPGRVTAVSSSDSPMKGVLVLLEAIAKLRTERDIELVVVGRPRPTGAVARAIGDLGVAGTVRFVHGLQESALADLFASAEVAVVPSLYEGFSIPAVEAMACEAPLVVTTAGALPEVVGPHGRCALHVEPGNARALARGIGTLLDDARMRRRMGAAGRRRVQERYTWRAVARATAACYAEAVSRSARRC